MSGEVKLRKSIAAANEILVFQYLAIFSTLKAIFTISNILFLTHYRATFLILSLFFLSLE